MTTSPRLTDCVTLNDIAPRVGSYFNAYSLAAAGKFGEPVANIGRSRLYDRVTVDAAVAKYLSERAQRNGRAA